VGADETAAVPQKMRPANVTERSVYAFLVAPLIQNVVLWAGIFVFVSVSTDRQLPIKLDQGFMWFVGGSLLVSYLIAATVGVIAHVLCVKLGFWRLWHYLLVGFLAGVLMALCWGLFITARPSAVGIFGPAAFFVPSAVVIALVVWLMVFWRNPPVGSGVDTPS